MLITKIVRGMPEEVKNKRILRIKEALNFPLGTQENPTHNVIGTIGKIEVFFDKPGKEYFRTGATQNINDMAPGVGDYYKKYSFGDIWKDLLNVSTHISEDSMKKLLAIMYRLAYMLDCEVTDNQVRFKPSSEIMVEIHNIQEEINRKKIDFKVLEFLNFLDVLGWNEDVKYQSDMNFDNYNKGRINNILSMISIPLIFKKFVDQVIETKDDVTNLDYTPLVDIALYFTRTRGIAPISRKELLEHLFPYVEEK